MSDKHVMSGKSREFSLKVIVIHLGLLVSYRESRSTPNNLLCPLFTHPLLGTILCFDLSGHMWVSFFLHSLSLPHTRMI